MIKQMMAQLDEEGAQYALDSSKKGTQASASLFGPIVIYQPAGLFIFQKSPARRLNPYLFKEV